MKVELATLRPNPMRDFAIDPLDEANVNELVKSIQEDGFWGGIVARRSNGHLEIAAGHHRVAAAIKAGVEKADIFVGNDIDDAGMIRVYARENATQRGNSSTAVAGTVASALRFIAKAVLTDSPWGEKFFTPSVWVQARASIASDRGIGRDVIVRFLDGVPSINDGTVQQQLANLKASGDYARIIGEVKAEIEEENAAALAEAAEQERLRLEWEAEQKRIEEEREARRKDAEERRRAAEEERKARIAAAEQRRKEAEEARKIAEAERKAAKEEAAREKAAAEAERRKAEAERERERISEEREQARIEAERQKKLKAEQAERDRAEKALADKRRKEMAEEAKKFEALKRTAEIAFKAAAKAAEREKTFDFEGVAKHFNNDHQVKVFREVVTGEGMRPYLPVEGQAALAAALYNLAREREVELSGAFIRENATTMVLQAKSIEREMNKDEARKLQEKDLREKMALYQGEFARNVRGMNAAGVKIKELLENNRSVTFTLSGEFRNAIETATRVINTLNKRI